MDAAGYPKEDVTKPTELLGVTALEKHIGKAKFAEILTPFIHKPPGSPTLVEETDKRNAINSIEHIQDVFKDVPVHD